MTDTKASLGGSAASPASHTPGPWVWSGASLGRFGVYENEHVLWPGNSTNADEEVGDLSETNHREWWALADALMAMLAHVPLEATWARDSAIEQARAALRSAGRRR